MAIFIDIGAAPANEACAQLGQTPDFDRLNLLECAAYRAALIARFGPPPFGCALVPAINRHDFGLYHSVALTIEESARGDAAIEHYAAAVRNGLEHWHEAGFAPPVRYDDAVGTTDRGSISDIILGAFETTRPGPDGGFAIADFATLHANLTAAFPDLAAAFAARAAASERR